MDKLDINSASAADFDAVEAVKGHGTQIVLFRDERGGFTEVKQLDEVPGLTGKLDGSDWDYFEVAGS